MTVINTAQKTQAMDTYTYNNIFETKGIEYLIIIGFFAILILFCRNHTWAHLSRNGIAEIGLDDLLLHITGNVDLVGLKQMGDAVTKGTLIAEISHNGKTLKILSPVSGEITAINGALSGDPDLMTGDPYGRGWIYRIKPTDWTAETSSYFLAGDAVSWLGNELSRFRDFLMGSASLYSHGASDLILQDGGELKDHTLSELPGEVWNSFQEDFMKLDEKGSSKGLSS
jgi:glycine cleavage system H protein